MTWLIALFAFDTAVAGWWIVCGVVNRLTRPRPITVHGPRAARAHGHMSAEALATAPIPPPHRP